MSLPRLPWRRLGTASVSALVALAATMSLGAAPASADNVATPGNFTGYGFDQCLAPNQSAMDAWLTQLAVLGGRHLHLRRLARLPCQPNLTPAWISTQLANGWRLLPITLGPQAWCTTRERYLKQVRINPAPAGRYAGPAARAAPRPTRPSGWQRARARRGQHSLVRHRGLRHLAAPTAASRR